MTGENTEMKERWDTLLVEDNEDDAFLLQRAFKTAGVSSRISHCRDGQRAVDYFAGESKYVDREAYPLPHLVLLDLQLPFRHGLEVLRWIRADPHHHAQVVIILTSSSEAHNVREAHRLQVNAYLVKPASLDAMVELARCIQTCWLNERLEALSDQDFALREPTE